ncbi:MAG: hypothetical protein LAT62_00800 [Natronospirillum sp.]|uniref:hypothetical protein n=1 Tax=Natronospirillum sp. TaxID=2812955 RepID=UPI0025F07584|nr:hypothetical protein [Natronospirillum sp.]MCH8550441.1 hypothetical protein [Natronospirillum sp.]
MLGWRTVCPHCGLPGLRVALLLGVVMLSGCSTYGERQEAAVRAVERGDYELAESRFDESLKDSERDYLLYLLEVGMVRHLAGDYEGSNALLEQADQLRDTLTFRSGGARFAELMTSPASGPYRGAGYEYAYVNYFKALNYLALARETGDPQWLDAARVEARRLEIILNEFAADEGDYLELATQEEDSAGAFLRILRQLRGDYLDRDQLIYRDDAWGRFLTGITYENLGEWDSARIAYQQSALAYEQGYAEQYDLGGEPARQAWTAVVRMMRTGGGWADEWPRLVDRKQLDEEETRPLAADESLLLVVEHAGRVPPIGELNLLLHRQPEAQSLMLRPLISREGRAGQEQLVWFTLNYADHGIGDLLLRYQAGGALQVLDNPLRSKQVYIGPLWDLAQESGLLEGIGPVGVRVSVPWYPPAGPPPPESRLVTASEASRPLLTMADPEQIKRQERLRLAQDEMTAALLRETVRNTTSAAVSGAVSEHGNQDLGLILGLLGRAATTATARAETRHWATMPRRARMAMVRVPAETQTVRLEQRGRVQWEEEVSPRPRQVNLYLVRTFAQR